jgi:hypothetical protein
VARNAKWKTVENNIIAIRGPCRYIYIYVYFLSCGVFGPKIYMCFYLRGVLNLNVPLYPYQFPSANSRSTWVGGFICIW